MGIALKLQTYRLADVLSGRDNNFSLLRLVAALAVMFGHSFWIHPGHAEPVLAFTHLEYSGSLSVYAFFLISGMLVSASYSRQQSLGRFLALRAGRIYPGYFVCVLLIAYLMYPVLTGASPAEAVANPHAWKYFSVNAEMFRGTERVIPGLFEQTGIHRAVNNSLWTLPLEVKCYAFVALAGLLGVMRRRWAVLLASSCMLGIVMFLADHPVRSVLLSDIAKHVNGYSFFPVAFFAIGMALYALRDRVALTWPVAGGLLAAYVILRNTPLAQPLLYAAFVYAILWLSATRQLRRLNPSDDLSYGVYLWAFPIQQMIAMAWPTMDSFASLSIAVPATLLAAYASWTLVERPAMNGVRWLLERHHAEPRRACGDDGSVPSDHAELEARGRTGGAVVRSDVVRR